MYSIIFKAITKKNRTRYSQKNNKYVKMDSKITLKSSKRRQAKENRGTKNTRNKQITNNKTQTYQ